MKAVLGAHWDARAETIDACAERTAALLRALVEIDPLLADWRDKGGSRRDALAQPVVTTDHADLVDRLLVGRNRTDVGNEVIEELGYAVSWWNSRETRDGGVTLRLHLGVTSPHVANSVTLNLPDSRSFPGLYEQSRAGELMLAVIAIFEPDRAVWSSSSMKKAQAEPDQELENGGIAYGQLIGHPAGWATYLSDASNIKFDNRAFPPRVAVDRLGSGTLVRIGGDPANPPMGDVLAVRVAMGYPLPGHLTPNENERPTAGSPVTGTVGSGVVPVVERRPSSTTAFDDAGQESQSLPASHDPK